MSNHLSEKEKKLIYESKYDFDNWAPILEGLIPKVTFLDFSLEEAKSMVNYYKSTLKKLILTEEDKKTIQNTQERVEKSLKTLNYPVYIRLGQRSPKDGKITKFNQKFLYV